MTANWVHSTANEGHTLLILLIRDMTANWVHSTANEGHTLLILLIGDMTANWVHTILLIRDIPR